MPTGQQLVNNALTVLGVLEQGGAPSASDSEYGLNELNDMWDAWGIDDGMVYAVSSKSFALASPVQPIQIGTLAAAPFNVPRPARIYQAFITTPVGAGFNRNPLKIVNSAVYYEHNDLGAVAATPDELYPAYDVSSSGGGGLTDLYLWPVPSLAVATTLELEMAVPFNAWALGDKYNVPYGFADALKWALAFRMLPGFGMIVAQEVAQVVTLNAQKSEERIRAMNALNRQIPPTQAAIPNVETAAKGA